MSENDNPAPQTHVVGEPVAWRYRGSETSDAIMGRHGEQRWQYCTAKPSIHPSWSDRTDVEPLYAAAPPTPAQASENIDAETDTGAQRAQSPETNMRASALEEAAKIADEEAEMWGHTDGSSARVVAARIRTLIDEDAAPPQTRGMGASEEMK